MRSRKSFLGLGILVLMLVLGVGYAVVNSVTLNISGTATAKEADLNVHFTGEVAVTDNAANASAEGDHDDKINATITVDNMTLEEEVTLVYTIVNEEADVNASLAAPVITVTSEDETSESSSSENETSEDETIDLKDYFTVTADLGKTTLNADGDTTTVTVTVALAKTPATAEYSTAKINIDIVASPAA